jgi:hypothetical protein
MWSAGSLAGAYEGVTTCGEAWRFHTESPVPLPVAAVQLVLAWLAARNVRPPASRVGSRN